MEIQDGVYICKINKIELTMSATEKEIMSVEFQITDETSQLFGQKFYMKQFINTKFGIHLAKEFFRSLDLQINIEFEFPAEIDDLGKKVVEAAKLMEFDIKQTTNGVFKNYTVEGIYDLVEI